MAFRSRKKYVSRREKLKRHIKVYRLIALYGSLFLVVWLLFNYRSIYDYLRTFFMD